MDRIPYHTIWTTEKEIEFLAKLGTYGVIRKDRFELLRGYLKSMSLRAKWDRMDPEQILSAVTLMLEDQFSQDTFRARSLPTLAAVPGSLAAVPGSLAEAVSLRGTS